MASMTKEEEERGPGNAKHGAGVMGETLTDAFLEPWNQSQNSIMEEANLRSGRSCDK